MLLYRSKDLQLFAFSPSRSARMPGWGVEVRYRRWPNGRPDGGGRTAKRRAAPVWQHVKLMLWRTVREDLRRGRGTIVPIELNYWKTSPGVRSELISLKSGFRFKIMRGGPRSLEDVG